MRFRLAAATLLAAILAALYQVYAPDEQTDRQTPIGQAADNPFRLGDR